jgi:hypothetical protein
VSPGPASPARPRGSRVPRWSAFLARPHGAGCPMGRLLGCCAYLRSNAMAWLCCGATGWLRIGQTQRPQTVFECRCCCCCLSDRHPCITGHPSAAVSLVPPSRSHDVTAWQRSSLFHLLLLLLLPPNNASCTAGSASAVVFLMHPGSEPSPDKLAVLESPLAAGRQCLVAINGPGRVKSLTTGAGGGEAGEVAAY